MFSTIFTRTLQFKRRAHFIVATLLTTMIGFSGAHAQLLENEIHSPLHVTESKSVLLDSGLVEMQVDDSLLQDMAIRNGEIIVKNFPVNDHETVDLVVKQFFPYKGDIHEAYYATDSSGNRVVRKRQIDITAKCFRGHVAGYPESTVVFGMNREMCNGFIEYSDTRHVISTDPATQVIVVSDPLAEQPGLQLVREMMREAVAKKTRNQGGERLLGDGRGVGETPPGGCAQISLSVVYGADFLALFAGDQQAAYNYIITLVGQVSEVYRGNGIIWVEPVVSTIFDGTGSVDDGALPQVLCDFVETSIGNTIPDVTGATGTGLSDGYLILRTGAEGAINFQGAQITKQSLGYWGGLTAGINPAAANPPPGPPDTGCPSGSNVNAVGAASGLIGASDTTGYDTYIVAQALGTLCGATPTGSFGNITALVYNALAGAPLPGVAAGLAFDSCDTGNAGVGTIMSSCMLPGGATMATNIDSRFAASNIVAMNAFLAGPPAPLVSGGTLVPVPIVDVAATNGGDAANCAAINVTWTSDPAATAEYVFRNTQNVFSPAGQVGGATLVAILPGGTGTYTDTLVVGGQQYYYWVASTNACNIDESFLIADQYNPNIMQPPPALPNTPGRGVTGTIGDNPLPIQQVMATVYEDCDEIIVTWDLSLPAPAGYPAPNPDTAIIWRSTDDIFDNAVQLDTAPMAGATFTDATVPEQGVTYYYWVTPRDSNCDEPDPPVVGGSAAGVLQDDLSTVTIRCGASNGSVCDGVLLSWIPEMSLLGPGDVYQIWRRAPLDVTSQQIGAPPAFINGVPNTQFHDNSAQPGIEYEYWVIGENECSTSIETPSGAIGYTAELEKPEGVLVVLTDPGDPDSPSCGDVEITWNEVARADAYEIWRSDTNDFYDPQNPPTSLGETTDVSFIDTPPVAGQTFYYWVASVSYLCPNDQALSTTVSGASMPALVQPTNLRASKGGLCDRIKVEWDGSFDGTTFTISRNTTDDFASSAVVGSIDDLGYYEDLESDPGGPVSGTAYYYWVVADNECGTTSESDSDSGFLGMQLAAPEGLDATSGSYCAGVQLTWNRRVMAQSYRIYRDINDDPSSADMLDEVLPGISTYIDATAVVGVPYFYWVEAVNNCSEGEPPILQATAAEGLNGSLLGPSGVLASDGEDCGFVEISWTDIPIANNYVVWRNATDDYLTAVVIDNIAASPYTDNTVIEDTPYYYWITADSQWCVGANQSASVIGSALPELAVVTGISAEQGIDCGEVLVTWDVVTAVIDYDIYRNDTGVEPTPGGGDPDDTPVGTRTEAFFSDDTAVAGTQYYYWVQATTACGEGVLNEVATGFLAEPIGAPAMVGQSDSDSCTDITIIWEPVFGADSYTLYRGTSNVFGEAEIIDDLITEIFYIDGSPVGGQSYFYWVKSHNGCGDSPESISTEAANHTLDSATINTVSDDLCGVIDLTWAPVSGADEYHIYYSQNPDPQNQVPATYLGKTTNTFYTDQSPLLDTTLYYWVRAVVNLAETDCVSDWGGYASGISLGSIIIPQDLSATVEEHCDEVWLSWSVASTADTTYRIYRSETNDPAGTGIVIGSTTTTDFIDTTPVQATAYYYWVTGESSCGVESDFSAETSGWTEVTPVAPTDVAATEAGTSTFCNSVELTWLPAETADAYIVWRSESPILGDEIFIAETVDTFYSDVSTTPGTEYTYWVTTKNDCGESDINIVDPASGSNGELTPPTDVEATDGTANCGQVDLTWTAVDLATGYFIYRSDDADFANAVLIGVADGPSYIDYVPTVFDQPAYYFVASVTNACQTPSLHSPAEAGSALPPLTIPTDIIASVGTDCGAVQVNWTEIAGTQTYSIYRNETGVAPTPGEADPDDTPIGSSQIPPYVDDTVVDDTEYYYWVQANNTCDSSNLSLDSMGVGAVPITTSPNAYATLNSICNAVEITWDELPSATLYHIYRNIEDDFDTASVISQQVLGTNTWQDITAVAGETYYYWVSAENGCGESPIAGSGSPGMIGETTPPSTVDATDGECGIITVTWSASDGASSYDIYRNQTNNFGTATLVGSTGELTFDDTSAFPLIPYYYWITSTAPACNASVASTATVGSFVQNVEAPVSIGATYQTICNNILVSWTHPGMGTTFTVSRNDVDDFATAAIVSSGASDQSYLDTPPLPNTQYFYWVQANNSCGDSDVASSTAVIGQAVGATDAPTSVVASDGSSDLIDCSWVEVRWAPVSDADLYNIYRSTEDVFESAGVAIGTAGQNENTFTDTTAEGGVTYFYWVVGVNICGESANESASDSGYNGVLANPANVQTFNDPADDVGCGEVLITWDAVAGNTGYRVYRSDDPNDPNPWFLDFTSTESYVDMSAVPEVSYFYFVATDNNQCVEVPGVGEHGMALPYTSIVQDVVANNLSCNIIELSWTAELWAATYTVSKNTVDDFDTAALLGSTTLTTYTDLDVSANTEYFYWVTTDHDLCGTSLPSEVASAVAAIPVVLNTTATSGLCESVEVSWDNIAEQATYHIYRNIIDDPFSAADVATSDGSPYLDTTTLGDTTYYYWVTAEPTDCAGNEGEFGSSAVGLSVGDLASPLNVFASQGSQCGSVLVQWTVAGYPASFTIYRADGVDALWADAQPLAGAIVVPPASQFADFTAIPGVTYTYWVVANNDCGSSDSSLDGVSGFIGELANPTNLAATDDECGVVTITWDSVDLADSYIVSRSETDDFTQSIILPYTGVNPTYVDSDAGTTPGQQFFYWVQSVNDTCTTPAESSVAGVALANMAIPENVAATSGTHCNEIWVSWDAAGIDTLYTVHRSDLNDEGTALPIGTTENNTYVDDDVVLVAGDTYYYWVTGTNSCGESVMSLAASGYSSATPVGPTEVSATDTGLSIYCDSVLVEWLPAPTAETYVVHRSASGDIADAQEIGETPLTSFEDTLAEPDQEYTYWILTRNACGDSLIGDATSTTGSIGQIAPPNDVASAAAPCGQVDLSWTPVTNATAYEIYRSIDPDFTNAVIIGLSDGPTYSDFAPSDYDTPLYYFVGSVGVFCTTSTEQSTATEGIAQPPLDIPTDTVASVGAICEEVWVNWTETAGAQTYDIYRNTTGVEPTPGDVDPDDTPIVTVQMPPYTDAVGADDTEFYYWVRANNSCGSSSLSLFTSGLAAIDIPQSPVALATQGLLCDSVDITWDEVDTGTLYHIYRHTVVDEPLSASELGTVPVGTTFWQDLTALPGITYYYWVTVENGCGESPVEDDGTDGWIGQLSPPANIVTSEDLCGSVALSWDTVVGNNGYQVYRGIDPYTPDIFLGSPSAESWVDYPDDPNVPYYYFVTTLQNGCEGPQSSGMFGMSLPEMTPVQNVQASNVSCNFVTLTWTPESWNAEYTIWQSTDNVFVDATAIGTTTDAFFTDGTVFPNTQYYYWVIANHTECGSSPASVVASAISDVPQVQGVASTLGVFCDYVEVSWSDLGEGATYYIYRNETGVPPTPGVDAEIGSSTTSPYQDDDATANTEYFYWVTAEPDSCGEEGTVLSDPSVGRVATLPTSPTNVTATLGTLCSSVELQWGGAEHVDQYRIYRAESGASWADASEIGTTASPSTTFIDNTPAEATDYTYWVVAETMCGSSDPEDPNGVLGYSGTIENPAITSVSDDQCGVIDITWDLVQNADEYHIYYSHYEDPQVPVPATYLGVTTTNFYTDESPLPDTATYYWVRSVVYSDSGDPCVTFWGTHGTGMALGPVMIPEGLTASLAEHCDDVWLNWDQAGTNETTYKVYRNTTGVEPTPGGVDPDDAPIGTTTGTAYIDSPPVQGDAYYYWITATSSCDVESETGSVASGWTATDPISPTDVFATDSGTSAYCDSVVITWLPQDDADSYVVYRADSIDVNNAAFLDETPDFTFTDATALAGVEYTYWVTSKNVCSESALNDVTGVDQGSLGEVPPPTDVVATDGTANCGQIDLIWTAVPDASAYFVYRGLTSDFAGAVLIGVADSPMYTDFNPEVYDTPMYYFVSSVNPDCQSPTQHSTPEEGTAQPPITIPEDVNATNGTSCGEIWVSWTETPGALSYKVYSNTTGVEPNVLVDPPSGSVQAPPFVDEAIIDTLDHYYWVQAVNSCGDSNVGLHAIGIAGTAIAESPAIDVTNGSVCDSVDITWDEVETATYYRVYRNTLDDSATATVIAQPYVGTSFWQDTTAVAGQEYYYWVTAENDCGESPLADDGLLGSTGQLEPPTQVTASNDACDIVTIDWDEVTGAVEYEVFRNMANDFATALLIGTTGEITFADADALPATPYYYWITAASSTCPASVASSSDIGSTLQGAEIPSSVLASQDVCGEVLVTWSHPGNGVTFTISRNEIDDFATAGPPIGSGFTDQQYSDTTIVDGTEYFYWVEAISTNGCDDSAESVSASGEAIGFTEAPTDVDASDGEACDSVQIQWTPVDHVENYNIYRSTTFDINTAGPAIGSVTQDAVVFDDTTAANGINYYYWVVGENTCGEGAASIDEELGFTGTLNNPENIVATSDCGAVTLIWDSVEGNSGYQVYRSSVQDDPNPQFIADVTSNTYVDTLAEPKTPYYYFIATSHNSCFAIPPYGEQGVALPDNSAVENVSAYAESCSLIILDWTAESWAAEYTIWRDTTNVFDILVNTQVGSTSEAFFKDATVDANTQYYYWVTTDHATCGQSPASDSVTAETLISVVADVAATVGECDLVEISWTTIGDQATYHIYRYTANEPSNAVEIGTSSLSPYRDTDLLEGVTQYYYWVTASPVNCVDEEGEFSSVSIGQSVPSLPTPDPVSASQGTLCGEVLVEWTAPEHTDYFEVYRSDDIVPDIDDALLLGTIDGALNSYSDTSAFSSVTYNYWVVAVNGCGSSPTQTEDGVTGHVGELANPDIFTASGDLCGVVLLDWSDVPAADSYILSRSDTDSFDDSGEIYTGPDTHFEINEPPDQTLYYWVQTVNNDCVTDAGSSVVGLALAVTEIPANVEASPETHCGSITVTWDASQQQVDTLYQVYRSLSDEFDPNGQIGEETTATTYVDSSVEGGTPYYYWVKGTNSCGTSQESLVASGVPADSATPPENVVASDSGSSFFCNQVVITWLASPNADSYMVYRSETSDIQAAELLEEDITITSYIDNTALPVTEYTYWIVGVTSCGPHGLLEANGDTGSLGQLPPPTNVQASDVGDGVANCGSVLVTWVEVPGAIAYRVYRSITPLFEDAVEVTDSEFHAQGDSYTDYAIDGFYDIPLYYWVDSVGIFCGAPDVVSAPTEGSTSPPLAIPTGLIASHGTVCGQVQIQWDPVPDALSYHVYRHDTETVDDAVFLASSDTNNYSDPVVSGTYYYWVKSINTCSPDGSALSQGDSGFPSDEIIQSPTVSATQGTVCDHIILNWNTELSANRYFIHRGLESDGSDMEDIGEVAAPTTTYDDYNVEFGRTYYYWVTAENSCGSSEHNVNGQSGWVGDLPAPTNVQASDGEYCGSIFVTWDEVDNSVDYNIYKLEVGDQNEPGYIGSSNGATTFTDFDVDASTQYYYYVKSVNNNLCGESPLSSSDLGQSLPPIVIPDNIDATYNEQCGQITVTWEHDAELTTYNLWRGEEDNIDGELTTEIATGIVDTQFIDSIYNDAHPIVDGVPYFYWVVAFNECGLSEPSQPAALGYAAITEISTPEGLVASPHCNSVTLAWIAVEGATSYELTRYQTDGGPGEIIYVANDGSQTTYVDSDVVSSVTYYYEVVSVNACSSSDPTEQIASSPTAANPPTGIDASDSDDGFNCQVLVSWDWDESPATFIIYRGSDSDSANAQEVGNASQSPWIDYAPLSSAYYFVKANTVECGLGDFSTGDIGSPDQGYPNPANVEATNGEFCDGILVSWDQVPGPGITYCVYRSVAEAPQTAEKLECAISWDSVGWPDTNVEADTPYWYWVTTEVNGTESCELGSPDQGWPSEEAGVIHDLNATTCNPDYVIVTWWGTNLKYDVAWVVMPQPQGPLETQVIAYGVQSPYIDANAPTGGYYYVRPVTACGAVGEWSDWVYGNPASCFGGDLPEGLLGTDPGDPTILIVPSDLNNDSGHKPRGGSDGRIGNNSKGGHADSAESVIDSMPPWSLCLVGDAEITTDPTFILGDTRWSLPLGGNWRLVGREGYADLFFLAGSDWEHVRSLRVKEIESGVASTLLEDGLAAVVGTVPEAGNNVLITGVSSDDCDNDGVPDGCEILLGLSLDMNIDGVPDSCSADLNGDGAVDSFDLIEVLQHFGEPIEGYGDVNDDGIVDQSDVLSILSAM